MGFGFNLIGFPLLILLTIGLIVGFIFTRKKGLLKLLGIVWGLLILLIIVGTISDYYRRPIRLTKNDIVGTYRIDTSFYPGENARWQYEHVKFQITEDDEFILTVMQDDNNYKELHGQVVWSSGPPDLWTVKMDDTTHHIVESGPTLYRGHDRFYYVFESSKWNNMFFRKEK
ncbi:hypothetical protein [Cesiribacter sp. SM1]|uniref:hypothetical protein n=1 Tax=Cesiribacter sp. SM1 TaxID=2861196 RepID=UPI001CD3BB7A|nr:hypothetical protein [Cesiribacter sp. SM1]